MEDYSSGYALFCFVFIVIYFSISHYVSSSSHLFWIPEAAIIIVMGLVVTVAVSLLYTEFSPKFDSALFFRVFLPPIIFSSGFKLDVAVFYDNVTAIMVFANIGTVVNIIAFGLPIWLLGWWKFTTPMSFMESLSFGSVVSATDPVATIVIFDHLQVEPALYAIVVGVSVLDDAVSVIMFDQFNHFITHKDDLSEQSVLYTLWYCTVQFVAILCGSVSVGYVSGTMFAWAVKTNRSIADNTTLFHCITLCFVYISYFLADALHLSGIISTMFAAMAAQRYLKSCLSEEVVNSLSSTVNVAAQLFETIVFFLIGSSSLQNTTSSAADWGFISWSLLLCVVSRAVQIYPLSVLLNLYNSAESSAGRRENRNSGIGDNGVKGSSIQMSPLYVTDTAGARITDSSNTGSSGSSSSNGRVVSDLHATAKHNQQHRRSSDSDNTDIDDIAPLDDVDLRNKNSLNHGENKVQNQNLHNSSYDGSGDRDNGATSSRSTVNSSTDYNGHLSAGYQHMLFFAGLRGPISYATSKLFPALSAHGNVVACATTAIIFSTIVVLGPLTVPALQWCQIKYGADLQQHDVHSQSRGSGTSSSSSSSIGHGGGSCSYNGLSLTDSDQSELSSEMRCETSNHHATSAQHTEGDEFSWGAVLHCASLTRFLERSEQNLVLSRFTHDGDSLDSGGISSDSRAVQAPGPSRSCCISSLFSTHSISSGSGRNNRFVPLSSESCHSDLSYSLDDAESALGRQVGGAARDRTPSVMVSASSDSMDEESRY